MCIRDSRDTNGVVAATKDAVEATGEEIRRMERTRKEWTDRISAVRVSLEAEIATLIGEDAVQILL